MNKVTVFTLGTIIGIAAGAFGGWMYTKKKYQKIADEEIASIKEHYSCPKASPKMTTEEYDKMVATGKSETAEKATQAKNKVDIMEYASKIKNEGYNKYSKSPVKKGKKKALVVPDSDPEEVGMNERPYIVSPDEFGENDHYESITLMYFADGVLTDDNNELLESEADAVGTDYVDHFGEFERDCVYVRNDKLKCDYEILKDARRYEDLPEYEKSSTVDLKPRQK